SYFGAFSGRRDGPGLWVWLRLWSPTLRLRGARIRLRSYGSALQLRGSSICGTGHGRNDCYYHDASSGLHGATSGVRLLHGACGFAADLCLRAWIWIWLHTRVLEPRLLGPLRLVALTARRQLDRDQGISVSPCALVCLLRSHFPKAHHLTYMAADSAAFFLWEVLVLYRFLASGNRIAAAHHGTLQCVN